MQISVDFRTGIPIYIQIMEQIKHLIATGELNSGDQLPTVRQLATDLRVNFNTIARAYRLLDEAGIISTQHGRGTYILEPQTEQNHTVLRQQALDALTEHYFSEAKRLGCTQQDVSEIVNQHLQSWKHSEAAGEAGGDE